MRMRMHMRMLCMRLEARLRQLDSRVRGLGGEAGGDHVIEDGLHK
jgi:hypothetical protein